MIFQLSVDNNQAGHDKIEANFRDMLHNSHYFNEDNSIDRTYCFRFITDEGFFLNENEKNARRSEILKSSRKAYFDTLINEYYLPTKMDLKLGFKTDVPKVKADYSGWVERVRHDRKDSVNIQE